MKATELMIGDWVLCDGEHYQIAEIGGMVCIDAKEQLYAFLEDIEPIPLTQEILEKNLKEFILGLNCMYELGGPYCISLEQENCWVFGLATKAARYPMVKIRFVHELQHALRLCGIEKEIEI